MQAKNLSQVELKRKKISLGITIKILNQVLQGSSFQKM